ncbi:MAG: D-alanyl-D-alanine carboxypeptidase/D-alanyl-D-alanine-endopeptidase [Cyanobacteria bacterium J06623_7]
MRFAVGYFSLICSVCCLFGNFNFIAPVLAVEESPSELPRLGQLPPRACLDDRQSAMEDRLEQEVLAIIEHPQLKRSRWGIEVQTLAGESIYSLAGDKFFNPASAAKLLVSAAGLLELGADYQLKTPIYSEGTAPVLTSLRLKGQGDPTLSSQSLKDIVHQLQERGIKRIENLIIDDSYLAAPAINPTWEWLDVHSYFATAVNSTILNENTATLTLLPQQVGQPVKFFWNDAIAAQQWQVVNQATTGKADIEYAIEIDGDLGKPLLKLRGELAVNERPDVWDLAVLDPARYFLESLRFHLSEANITVTRGTVSESAANFTDTELIAISAPPLRDILAEINQQSNNLYAEALGKILARKLEQDTAIAAINQSLQQIGIAPSEYVLVDASGLSRQNLVSPQTLVKLLRAMSDLSPSLAHAYRQSLAQAGTNGTLTRRFVGTNLQGNLAAKTGTLTGVGALSGYLSMPEQETLVFSILVNNSELEQREVRQAIDKIIAIVAQFNLCGKSHGK